MAPCPVIYHKVCKVGDQLSISAVHSQPREEAARQAVRLCPSVPRPAWEDAVRKAVAGCVWSFLVFQLSSEDNWSKCPPDSGDGRW